MRYLASIGLASLAAAGLVSAQSPLLLGQPLTSANQGNPNGGIYFDMTVNTTLTIDSITYVASDATPLSTNSSLNIYIGPSTYIGNVSANPGPWVLVGSSTPVLVNTGTATADTTVVGVIQPAGANPGTVTFPPGTYGIALEAVGHSWGYQNGVFTFTNSDLSVTTGGASNTFLTLPTFSPRTINGALAYTLGGTPMSFAARENYGNGCYANYQSFYEFFPNPASGFDLSNTSLQFVYDPGTNTYTVLSGTTPVDFAAVTSAALVIGASDNSTVTLDPLSPVVLYADVGGTGIASNQVDVNSDGYITFIPGANPAGGANNNPTTAAWLNGGARFGCWHDMDPTLGGTIHYDFDGVNHLFTWQGVPSRGQAATVNTFQIAIDAAGIIEIRFDVMDLTVGGAWPTLLGYTPGAGALDPGTIDISASTPFSTQANDSDPLHLEADANPVTGTTVNLTTTNESTQPGVGICFVTEGQISPGFDLGVIGAPGCLAHVDINLGAGFVIDNFPINGMTLAFPIPNSTSIVGLSFYCQSAWLDPMANAFGVTTSNGVRLAIGSF